LFCNYSKYFISDPENDFLFPDGPGIYIQLNKKSHLISDIEVSGIYLQTFSQKTSAIILPEISSRQTNFPMHARFLCPPLLELLTEGNFLTETDEMPETNFTVNSNDELIISLIRSFEVYGFPLTDPVYRIIDEIPVIEQRFSNGWIRYKGL